MKYVIFSRVNNFPFSIDAFTEKTKLMGMAINSDNSDYESLVLNIVGKEKLQGSYSGVKYMYMVKNTSSNKLIIIFSYILGFVRELSVLIKMSRKKQIAVYIMGYRSFFFVLYYRVLSKILKFKIVINIMEYHIVLSKKSNLFKRVNSYFFDRFSFSFADGALPISHFLHEYIKKNYPYLKQLILPSFTDFKKIDEVELKETNLGTYFMYCGSITYKDIINFIIDSFLRLQRDDINLLLVVSGHSIELISKYKSHKNIIFKSKLDYNTLYSYYKQAHALLIPLRSNNQDIARFPHKISEYLATKRPIITTEVGEVNYYLKDLRDAYIAKECKVVEFSLKMNESLLNVEKAASIGENGYIVGKNFFDYPKYGSQMVSFFNNL